MKLLVMQLSPPSRHSIPLWDFHNNVNPINSPVEWNTKPHYRHAEFDKTGFNALSVNFLLKTCYKIDGSRF
jgi:hypothetical protein